MMKKLPLTLFICFGAVLSYGFDISSSNLVGKTFYGLGIDSCSLVPGTIETEGRCPYIVKSEILSSTSIRHSKLPGYDSAIQEAFSPLMCACTIDDVNQTFTNDCPSPTFDVYDNIAVQTLAAYETRECASMHVQYLSPLADENDTMLWFFNEASAKAFYDEIKNDPMTPLSPRLDVSSCPPVSPSVVVIPF